MNTASSSPTHPTCKSTKGDYVPHGQNLEALTLGAHYKYNDGISTVNNQTGGAPAANGIKDHDGVDFTLYTSKLFTQLPRPVLVELGGRATKRVWNGLGGFTRNYSALFDSAVGYCTQDSEG